MKIVGISGPSCSGKSTLGRHLRQVLPNSMLIYEDDFYLPESQLPLDRQGRPNWDVPASFDLARMRAALAEIRRSDTLPVHEPTREDQNNPSDLLLTDAETSQLRQRLAELLGNEPVLLVDGILLFHEASPVEPLFDLKLLMGFEYADLKRRREARKGYATGDNDFWVDPSNFFEEVVWPEFETHCGFLYDPSSFERLSHEAQRRGIVLARGGSMYNQILRVGSLIAPSRAE